jgi:Tfp pilus assembly protein FimV
LVLSRARALLADGQTEPAARLLSGVIARSDSEDARLMPARVHLVRGDTDAARRTVAEVLDRGDVTTRRRVLEDDALRHLEPELTAPGVVR